MKKFAIRRLLFMVGSLLLFFGVPNTQAQVLHKVSVVDHEFQPNELHISEGDVVRWEWKGDLHNVVAVTAHGGGIKSGAFESELLNTKASYEVEFSRELLNQYARDSGVFEYVCEPHAFFGMNGLVSVERAIKTFVGSASEWQAGGTGSEELGVIAELSGNERNLKLTVPSAVTVLLLELRTGGLGEVGGLLCSGSLPPGGELNCAVEDSNQLFQGNMFVTLDSRLRAQLVRQGLRGAVSGRVRSPDGLITSGVTVSSSNYSTQSDPMGYYRLKDLPYGVYRVGAHFAGTEFKEFEWSNPILLITTEVYQRDFETSTRLPSITPVPGLTLSDICQEIKHQISLFSPSIHNSFDLGISYLSENNLVEFLRAQRLRVKAKILRGDTFEDAELDGLLSVSLPQGKSLGDFEVLNRAGDSICETQFTVVIESPLIPKNLRRVRRYLIQAKGRTARGVLGRRYLDEASALLAAMASGGEAHPRYPDILNRSLVERVNVDLNRIRNAPRRSSHKLAKLLERVSQSIELLEAHDRIQPHPHTSHGSEK